MTNEEAKMFLDNLKVCIYEHPVVADWLVEIANRKTENSSEKPNNCEDEPTTQTETQNSNLTFEKRTMRDCYNCKRYETEGECIECHYEPKDEQTEREGE